MEITYKINSDFARLRIFNENGSVKFYLNSDGLCFSSGESFYIPPL